MKNAFFPNATLYASSKNRRFEGKYHHHHGDENLQTRNNVSSNWQLKHAAKKYCVRKKSLEWETRIREVKGVVGFPAGSWRGPSA
jgi:hypothetical protein